MIYLGSRYQDQRVATLDFPDKSARQMVLRDTVPFAEDAARLHVWVETDRIDQVAEKYLGSGDRWWSVMDVNPEVMDAFAIQPGQVIRIPDA